MNEKESDFVKLNDDLDQLLNSALTELNNPTVIRNEDGQEEASKQSPFDKSEELNQLTDTFKKLMDSSNDNGFDETMLKTIRKLEENMKSMPEDADGVSDEEMAKIWEQMTNQTDNGDEVFPQFFLDIMQKLLAKDVLYPPLKDLSTKFPDWLAENKDQLSDEEFTRYSKQHTLVDQVCSYYEEIEDTDGNTPIETKKFQKILTAMQEMQQCGQPPEALVANGQNPTNFQPSSMDDFNEFNKLMAEGGANMDQCKTM